VRRIAALLFALGGVAIAPCGRAGASVTIGIPSLNLYAGWLDVNDAGNGGGLMKMERGYNSTTTFSGLFGYGWGTWEDQSLQMRADGQLQYEAFGGGSKTVLGSARFVDAADPVPELLGAAHQAQMVGSDAEEQRFRDDMRRNATDALNQYEAFLKSGMLAPKDVSFDEVFQGHSAGVTWARVVRVPEGYQLTWIPDFACTGCSGFEGIFNLRGHIVRSWLPNKPQEYVAYTYDDNDRLKTMQDGHNKRYSFTYDAAGHVARLETSASASIVYTYKSYPDQSADLISVRYANGNTLQYAYDSNHDLTEIGYPDKTTLRATYVGGAGNVATVVCPDGTKYTFERSKDAKPVVTMTAVSPAGVTSAARFDPDHHKPQLLCK